MNDIPATQSMFKITENETWAKGIGRLPDRGEFSCNH
jgi:hypothetical protein